MLLMPKNSIAMPPYAVEIGSGFYGTVSKIYSEKYNSYIAVKHMNVKNDHSDIEFVNKEIENASLLSSKDHPNIVKYLEHQILRPSCYIYFEFLRSNLEKILRTEYSPFITKLKWILDLITGIDFMHKNGIIHGDLKPANLLLTNSNRLKICDFGLAHNLKTIEDFKLYHHGELYTLWYRAPELMLGDTEQATDSHWYNEKIDIWAFGLIAYEILTGEVQLPGNSEYDQMLKTFRLSGTPSEASWEGVSQFEHFSNEFPKWQPILLKINEQIYHNYSNLLFSEQQDLFWSMLNIISSSLILDPSKRPTARQLRARLENITNGLI